MKRCKCGFDNLDEAKFCAKCGSILPTLKICLNCGRKGLPSDAEFCPNCGYKMSKNKSVNKKMIKKEREKKLQRNGIYLCISIVGIPIWALIFMDTNLPILIIFPPFIVFFVFAIRQFYLSD